MDILQFYTQADPDATDPTTPHKLLDELAVESRRTARIVSHAARSEDADELAQDALWQFSEFADHVSDICEEAERRFSANGSRRAGEPPAPKPYKIKMSVVPRCLFDSEIWVFPNPESPSYPILLGVYIPAHLVDEAARHLPLRLTADEAPASSEPSSPGE